MGQPTIENTHAGRLRELDGWRAISVLLVIFFHLGSYQHADIVAPHQRLASLVSLFGPLGVKVFFVISGFVICRLLILEEKRYGAISLKGFYIRRFFRIVSPFYLYLATLCLLLLAGLTVDFWKGILVGAFFLYDFDPLKQGSWFVGHTWSLAVEEQFYLTFPTLWVIARRMERKRIFPLVFGAIAAWNLSVAIFAWDRLTNPDMRAGFACISFGVLVAIFETRARAIAKAVPALAVAACAFGLFCHPHDLWTGWKTALFESFFTPPAIALLLVFSLERGKYLRAFLCSRPMQAIGLTSYGIYLWQQLFTAPSKFFTPSGKPIMWMLPMLLLIIPASYLLVEKPSMRLGKILSDHVRRRSLPKVAV
jgi:peptidoglycan/LPS O-acetylase OafA/YrhL